MKKTIFLLIALISSACSPQVTEPPTATSTPLPTQTPIPMPTLHPEFIELQNTINAKDGFVLTNDGTIEYNGVEVPDIKVTADGNYVLVVGEEMILLEPDEVTLDPEKGVVPDGYELNENNEWVKEVESSTIVNGLEIVLGDKVGEYTLITDFPYPDGYDSQGAMDKYDHMRNALSTLFGGEWALTPEGNVALVNLETGTSYAAYERLSELYEEYNFVIDWEQVGYELLSGNYIVTTRDSKTGMITIPDSQDQFLRNHAAKILGQLDYQSYTNSIESGTVCSANKKECVVMKFSDLNRAVGEPLHAVVTVANKDGKTTDSFVVKTLLPISKLLMSC